jgi:hypothetical protein
MLTRAGSDRRGKGTVSASERWRGVLHVSQFLMGSQSELMDPLS